MIPVKLRMRNFMPYKGDAPELCFAPIHTACISGDNGAGKSSIIDAITWALWGKSRAKSDDDLIHQGENEAQVEFDFSASGQLYRVIRKHARPKGRRVSGQSSLDLFICSEGSYLPLSGERITQTQEKIESILHMDYDTFTNSAYLRQGHADEFTRQQPAKRKEVLASILGLAIYDTFEESAKDKAKAAELEKLKHSAAIEELEAGLAQRAACESELKEVEADTAPLDRAVATAEKDVKKLRGEAQKLESVQSQMAQLDSAIQRHNEDLKRESERLAQSKTRLAAYHKLVGERGSIESGYVSLENASKLADELGKQALALSKLAERKRLYERKLDQAQAELNKQHALVSSEIQKLDEKSATLLALRAEQQKLAPMRQAVEKLEAEVAARREAAQQKKSEQSSIAAGIAGFKSEIASIDEKLKLLVEHEHGAKCPVCETELGEEKLEIVQARYAKEKNDKLRQVKQGEAESARLAAEIKAADAGVAALEQKFKKESQTLAARESVIAQSIKEASDASSKLADKKAKLAEIEEALATHAYARPEQEALARIEAEVSAIAYDESKLESAQSEAERLKGYEEQKKLLDEALKFSVQEQENAVQAEKTIANVKSRLADDTSTRETLAAQLSCLPELTRKLEQAEAEFKRKSDEQKALRERLAVLNSRLAEFKEKESRVSEKRKAYDAAAENESLYRELSRIFGKKGIQAMLIETALPEIEEEANRLLSRMTDGRMSLTFETQGVTKKGEVAETLDIKIGDELGTRSYEMFSGGEAFRIDFSVRIALSRLLARRAGAPLPTLIIDEGFGTQDADGIEKLKEAINSVQDDFQKILVITHIDELKDAFPTRIEVVKTAEGSTIQVS